MRTIDDEKGNIWVATAIEEVTPRHHGRWFMVFHPEGEESPVLAVPEIRWQTRESGERTIRTMSEFELRRRFDSALVRGAAVLP